MDKIIESCGPAKSEKKYEDAWRCFKDHAGNEKNFEEIDFGNYSKFLKEF